MIKNTGAGNKFSNNEKVKAIAEKIADNCPYIKGAHSYMSQGELDGKKYGKTYKIYITDPGSPVIDGVDITSANGNVTEIEVPVTLENIADRVDLTVWNRLTDLESFNDEILKKRTIKMAKSLEKKVIDATIYDAAQVAVGSADFKTLSDASTKLDELSVAGDKTNFVKPTVAGEIANGGLAKFIPAERMGKIYSDKYLGQYAGAAVVEDNLLPVVNFDDISATSATITLTPVSGTGVNSATVVGFEPVTALGGSGHKAGYVFSADGLKIVDNAGLFSDQDRAIITKDANGKIAELRIAIEGYNENNANCWVPAGTTELTLSKVITSGKYQMGQCRVADALGMDTYKFDDVIGADNWTETKGGVTVQVAEGSNFNTRDNTVRIDLPFASVLPDARQAVATYYKV